MDALPCHRLLVMLFLTAPLLAFAPPPQPSPPANNERAALELIAQVNNWRVEQGVWPLRPNPTLQALALAQARYLLSLNPLPRSSELHIGPNGTSPQERAAAEPYGWPAYGQADRVAIGENAAIGSLRTVISFWRGSDIHQRTALNPGYRVVGAAALPRGTDTLYIIVFGARPNVLPAFYSALEGRLYLSSERHQYAAGGPRIQNVSQVRLFGADGQPLTPDWIPWQAVINVPPGAGDTVYVLYSDGQRLALAEANAKDGSLMLPALLPPAAVIGTATPLPLAAGPTFASSVALPTVTAPAAAVIASPTPLPPVTASSTFTPTAALPSATPLPTADLMLLYDRFSLTVLNAAGRPLDLSTLAFSGSQAGFSARGWSQVAEVPLAAFPSGHCLQLTLGGSAPATPSDCRYVRSQVQVGAGRAFWTLGNFDVLLGGAAIATCPPVTGSSARCAVVTAQR